MADNKIEGRTVHASTDVSLIVTDLMMYGNAYTDGPVEGAGILLPFMRKALRDSKIQD